MKKKNDTNQILSHVRLMLNVNYPSLEECWAEGYEAAQLVETEESNPYPQDSIERQHWAEGWWAGYYEEEPLHMTTASDEDSLVGAVAQQAANEPRWNQADIKRWAGRVLKVAGTIAVTVAAVELLDMAV